MQVRRMPSDWLNAWMPARGIAADVTSTFGKPFLSGSNFATCVRFNNPLRSERSIDDHHYRDAPQRNTCEQRPIREQHVRWTSPARFAMDEIQIPEQAVDRKR